jgi:hypothetical protein
MKSRTDALPGAPAPVLTPQLLARLHTLNLDYLELLIAEHSYPRHGGMQYLPDRVLDLLVNTTAAARQALATTSYTLYSLGFEDQEFWCSALRADRQAVDVRYGALSTAVMQSSFCELALLHAWHVAVTQPIAARLLYGMQTAIIERIGRAQLWQLRRIAVDYPGLLMPRWPANPCFWPDMLRFAANGDARRLQTVQQLGHQLIAIDLQASEQENSPTRQRQQNLLKQRLRKGKP